MHEGPVYLANSIPPKQRKVYWSAYLCPYANLQSTLYSSLLRGSTSVVRDRGHICDRSDPQSHRLNRTDGCFPPGARPLDKDISFLQSHVLTLLDRLLRRQPRSVGGAFPRALETLCPSAGPCHYIARRVGDGHNCIIKGRLDMGYPIWNVLLFFPFSRVLCHMRISSYLFLLPTTVRRGPFRVLALVLVRCPRTGSDFRCLRPR